MAQFKETKYSNIPEWAICALEYGADSTELYYTEEERELVKEFQSQFKRGYVMEVNWESKGFSSYPDIGKFACDTYEVTFYEPID